MSEMDRFPMFTGHPAPEVPECRCGDGTTLRGYIKTYGETPTMTASNREHWKRRAEAAETQLAARPETAAPTPAPTREMEPEQLLAVIAKQSSIMQNMIGDWHRAVTLDKIAAALSSPVGETPNKETT